MAKYKILVDTDIFIDYFNRGYLRVLFENREFQVFYSVVTKRELLSKKGLKESEREAILYLLKKCRIINLDQMITLKYSELRKKYPQGQKEDTLIAATALAKKLPLLTRNIKHYKKITGLSLFPYPLF